MAGLKIGDTVRLKSGSPEMTVNYIGDEVYCAYFLNGEVKEVRFQEDALVKES